MKFFSLILLGLLLCGCDRGLIDVEVGKITSKTFVPDESGTHMIPNIDVDGNVSFMMLPYYYPPHWNVKIHGSNHVFEVDSERVYNLFELGEEVQVAYYSKSLRVHWVYKMDERIQVER